MKSVRDRSVPPKALSAGVVVVRFQDHEPYYLLLRAFRYWDFPKGQVESGEDPLQAAIREVEEETSLTGLRFRWGGGLPGNPTIWKG